MNFCILFDLNEKKMSEMYLNLKLLLILGKRVFAHINCRFHTLYKEIGFQKRTFCKTLILLSVYFRILLFSIDFDEFVLFFFVVDPGWLAGAASLIFLFFLYFT